MVKEQVTEFAGNCVWVNVYVIVLTPILNVVPGTFPIPDVMVAPVIE